MSEGGVDPLRTAVSAEVGGVVTMGDRARFATCEQQRRWGGGGGEAFGVAPGGGGEDAFGAGYGEDAVGDCEGPDLEAELDGEVGEVVELGRGGGHWALVLGVCEAMELEFVLRAGLCCGRGIRWCFDAVAYTLT